MSNWMQGLSHVEKPIIVMCHLRPLPGDPYYDVDGGTGKVMAAVKADLLALQEGRIDGIMFSNKLSLPYPTKVEPVTIAAMARVIGELGPPITVPYDVNCLWDPTASTDLVVAVDGKFIREITFGVYAPGFRPWNTSVGKTVRHRMAVGAKGLKLLFNIVPKAARYLTDRDIKDIARSTGFNNRPGALCVPGLAAGSETGTQIPGQVKASVKRTPILCNIGCSVGNITRQLSVADGAVCVTTFKYDGVFENAVDVKRVEEFTDKAKEHRATLQGAQMAGMSFKTHPKSGILRKQSLWYTKGIF